MYLHGYGVAYFTNILDTTTTMKKFFPLFLLLIAYYLFLSPTATAQTASNTAEIGVGVAQLIQVKDANVQEGDIISFNTKGYTLSSKPYDAGVIGVIVNTPAVSLEDKVAKEDQYIITTGTTLVRVTAANGKIKKGALIATSSTKGVGQLTRQEGYIIGNALESFDGPGIGKIPVSLHFGFNTSAVTLRTNLLNNFNLALTSPFQSPVNALRYFMAGIVAIIALGAGLAFFGRVTSRGIEALGRNPLATTAIIISIVINLVLALGILGIGLAIAYFVLIL